MDFGVLRETRSGERRVGLTPDAVRALVAGGHEVLVEAGAGVAAGFEDLDYQAAGAELGFTAAEVVQNSETLLKVRTPTPEELQLLTGPRILMAFLHLAGGDEARVQTLLDTGSTALAMELVEDHGRRVLLEPLSEIGGRVAMALVQYHLSHAGGGAGVLIGGWVGVPALHVVVLGAGRAGVAAAQEALNVAARVTVLDIDPRQLGEAADRLGKHAATAIASPYDIYASVTQADVVIGAVARPGQPAPKVLTRHDLRGMKPGSLFVDLSIDEGGCSETSRPTTLEDPIYLEEGVRHLCVPNLPSVVAQTASRALSLALLPYLRILGRAGLDEALRTTPALSAAAQIWRGQLASRRVAHFHGGTPTPLAELLMSP